VGRPDSVRFFRSLFRAAGEAERARQQQAYMKTELSFHGVEMATIRAGAADFCRAHELDAAALVGAVDALYATDWFDLHLAAIALLERKRALIGRQHDRWLIGLVRQSGYWALVDWLATKVVPEVLAPAPGRQLRAWARDDDFWVRRTALLAQLDALRAGGGDFALFAALAEPMLADKEFFIRKAIGWVLRDVAKKRPELSFAFVEEHGERMSGLTYREATRKLPAALRARLPPR
jgi:3-methyladenine DNA glycosylase AlkD